MKRLRIRALTYSMPAREVVIMALEREMVDPMGDLKAISEWEANMPAYVPELYSAEGSGAASTRDDAMDQNGGQAIHKQRAPNPRSQAFPASNRGPQGPDAPTLCDTASTQSGPQEAGVGEVGSPAPVIEKDGWIVGTNARTPNQVFYTAPVDPEAPPSSGWPKERKKKPSKGRSKVAVTTSERLRQMREGE